MILFIWNHYILIYIEMDEQDPKRYLRSRKW